MNTKTNGHSPVRASTQRSERITIIRETLTVLLEPGQVAELRIPKVDGKKMPPRATSTISTNSPSPPPSTMAGPRASMSR